MAWLRTLTDPAAAAKAFDPERGVAVVRALGEDVVRGPVEAKLACTPKAVAAAIAKLHTSLEETNNLMECEELACESPGDNYSETLYVRFSAPRTIAAILFVDEGSLAEEWFERRWARIDKRLKALAKKRCKR